MKPRFNIGDRIYWVESSCNVKAKIDCPICFGKKYATVILGNDERVETECDYCKKGMEEPLGYILIWEPNAEIRDGVVSAVSITKDGVRYGANRSDVEENEAFSSKEDAEPKRKEEFERIKAQRELWSVESFRNATKRQLWSVGYHRRCIKDAERTIAWHKMRLKLIKER